VASAAGIVTVSGSVDAGPDTACGAIEVVVENPASLES